MSIQQWHRKIVKSRVAATGISEDFTSCSNFANIAQTLTCAGGVGTGTAWELTLAYHTTGIGSQAQWAQADVYYDGSYDSAGLLLRSNGSSATHNYRVLFQTGSILIRNQLDNHISGSYNGSYAAGTYTVKASVTSAEFPTVTVWINGTQRISEVDYGPFPSGNYIGVLIDRDTASSASVVIDTFSGGAL